MNLIDMAPAVFVTIAQHLPTNKDRACLTMSCRESRRMMRGYLWSASDYESLAPHRQPPNDPQAWLQLNKERAQLRGTPPAGLLESCTRHVDGHRPERALALIAKDVPEPHRLYPVMRQALQMQGREAERYEIDEVMQRRECLERALQNRDMVQTKLALVAGGRLDRIMLSDMPAVLASDFWEDVTLVLHAMRRADCLNLVVRHARGMRARVQALGLLSPASDAALDGMMRRGGNPFELRKVLGHVFHHHLVDWQKRLLLYTVDPPSHSRHRGKYAEVLSDASFCREAVLRAEACVEGRSLFAAADRNALASDIAPGAMREALIGVYARAGLAPVQKPPLGDIWWRQDACFGAEKEAGFGCTRLSLDDVVRKAPPSLLGALKDAGFRLNTADVLKALLSGDENLSRVAKLRLLELSREGVWESPGPGAFARALDIAQSLRQRRQSCFRESSKSST